MARRGRNEGRSLNDPKSRRRGPAAPARAIEPPRRLPGAGLSGMRASMLGGTALVALAMPAAAQIAPNTRPSGGAVSAGQATIGGNGSTTLINQTSPSAVINWQSYNVGSAQTVQYQQPSARSFTLNRVLTANPSIIAGRIQANGQIAIVNQGGVLFAKGSQVDTAGLVVSSANITDADFMAGRLVFSQAGRPGAAIANAGNITIRQAGLAALVAPQVANSGTISAQLGRVVLGGATTHTLDLYGDGLTALNVTGQVTQIAIGGRKVPALVTNTGTILAPGGTVVLTASAADGVVTNLVSAGGTIAAATAGGHAGRVLVQGIGGGVTIDGTVSATGSVGGQVVANATGAVSVASGATIDVSGAGGGGLIAVGTTAARAAVGPKMRATMTAQSVTVARGARLRADATGRGGGGRVTLLSRNKTAQYGTITALGAGGGGGGVIEMSGQGALALGGDVSALGNGHGRAGTILIDPYDLDICDAHCPTAGSSSLATLAPATVETYTGNVLLTASGTISLLDAVSWAAAHAADPKTLEISAVNGITIASLLDAGSGSVALYSRAGAIVETNGGSIIAASLAAYAGGSVALGNSDFVVKLDASGNAIGQILDYQQQTMALSGAVCCVLNESGQLTFTAPTKADSQPLAGIDAAATGTLALDDSAGLSVAAPVTANGDLTISDSAASGVTPSFTLAAETSLTTKGGNIGISVSAGVLQLLGTVQTCTGTDPSGIVTLKAGSFGSAGSIDASAGTLIAGTLTGAATGGGSGSPYGGATLTSATNTVSILGGFTASGDFAFRNAASSLEVTESITAANIAIRTAGAFTLDHGVTLDANAASAPMLSVTSDAGTLALAGVLLTGTSNAGRTVIAPDGIVRLTAGSAATKANGEIVETANGGAGSILAGTLTGSAYGPGGSGNGPLGDARLDSSTNTVSVLGLFSTGGTFALASATSLTVTNSVIATNGDVALSVGTGSPGASTLTIGPGVTISGQNVSLSTSDTGVTGTAIDELGGAQIEAIGATGKLVADAASGDIAIAGLLETGTGGAVNPFGVASLTARAGSISEGTTGQIVVGTLTDSEPQGTHGDVGLTCGHAGSCHNTITTLGPMTIGGDLALEDDAAPSITAPVSVGGDFALNVSGNGLLVIGAAVDAGKIDWSTRGGILTLADASVTGTTSLALTAGGAIVLQDGALLASDPSTGAVDLVAEGATTFGGAYAGLGTVHGIATGGTIRGESVTLSALAGNVTERLAIEAAPSGVIQTGTLSASAQAIVTAGSSTFGTVSLDTASGASAGNQIGTLTGSSANGTGTAAFTLIDGEALDLAGPLTAPTIHLTAPTLTVSGGVSLGAGTSALIADQLIIDAGAQIRGGANTLLAIDRLTDGTLTVVPTITAGDQTDTVGADSLARIALGAGTLTLGSADGAQVWTGGSTGATWSASSAGSITDLRILAALDLLTADTAGPLGLFSNDTVENYARADPATSYGITVTTLFGAAAYTASTGALQGTGAAGLLDGASAVSSNRIGTLLAFTTSSTANGGVPTASPAFTLEDGSNLAVAGPVNARNGAIRIGVAGGNLDISGNVTGTDVFLVASGSIDQSAGFLAANGASNTPGTNGTIGIDALGGGITLGGALVAGTSGTGSVLLNAGGGDISESGTIEAGTLAAASSGNILLGSSANSIRVIGGLTSDFDALLPSGLTLQGLFSAGTTGIALTDAAGLTIADDTAAGATIDSRGFSPSATGTVSIKVIDGNSLTLGTQAGTSLRSYGDITLIADGAITQTGGVVEAQGASLPDGALGGNVLVESLHGGVTQSGGLFASDRLDVTVDAATAISQESGRIAAARNADLTAGTEIDQTAASTITAAGNAILVAGVSGTGGNISQSGRSTISAAGTVSLEGISGSVLIGAFTQSADSRIEAGQRAQIAMGSGIAFGGTIQAGTLAASGYTGQVWLRTAQGDITETVAQNSGVVLAGTLAADADAGNIRLDNASGVSAAGTANQIGTLSSLTATFRLGTADTVSTLNGLAAGTGIALTDLAPLTLADAAQITAGTGGIAITVQDFTGATQPALTLGTSAGATLLAAGNISLTADGTIQQNGGSALSTGGNLGLLSETGDVIQSHGLLQSSTGSVSVSAAGSLVQLAGTIAAGTSAALQAGADMVQSGSSTIMAGGEARLLAGCQQAGATGCAAPSAAGGTLTQNEGSAVRGTLILGSGDSLAIGGTLDAGTGAMILISANGITETVNNATTGSIRAGTLAASATGGNLDFTSETNTITAIAPIGTLTGLAASGAISLTDSVALAQRGGSVTAGDSITITAQNFAQSASAALTAPGLVRIASALSQAQASLQGGTVEIDGDVAQSASTLRATGDARLQGSLAQVASTLTAGGMVSLGTGTAGTLAQSGDSAITGTAGITVTLAGGMMQTSGSTIGSDGDVTIASRAGDLLFAGAIRGADVSLTATGGAVGEGAGGQLTATGAATITAADGFAQTSAALEAGTIAHIAAALTQSQSTLTATTVQIDGSANQTASMVAALGGGLTVGGGLTQAGAQAMATGPLRVSGGTILQTGGSRIEGTESVTLDPATGLSQQAGSTIASAGPVQIASTAGNLAWSGTITGDGVTLSAPGGLSEAAGAQLISGGGASVTLSGGSMVLDGTIRADLLIAQALSGGILQNAGGEIDAATLAAAATGTIALTSPANHIATIAATSGLPGLTAASLTLEDAEALTLASGSTIAAGSIAISVLNNADLTEAAGSTLDARDGSAALLSLGTITLAGDTTARRLLLAANTQGGAAAEVDWTGGTLTTASSLPAANAGGKPQVAGVNHLLATNGTGVGAVIVSRAFRQTGTTIVDAMDGGAAVQIGIAGGGTAQFAHLSAPSTQLLLDLTRGGSTSGTIAVGGLDVFYDLQRPPSLPALLFGTVAGQTGTGAAAVSYAQQNVGGNFQAIGNIKYQINACPLGSINCVLLSPIVVPVISPIPNLTITRSGSDDDADLLPNVAVEDY